MSIFTSQFDRARPFAQAYAGAADEPGWRTPAGATALLAAAGLTATAAVDAVDGSGWGDGWESGWGVDAPAPPGTDHAAGADQAWMDRGEYTGAGVGGDGDFFYFIDGDSSLTIDH